jgi:antitoxin (DNA-binding transcriptional repressor) of toxin-antitoxin stability system
MKMITATELARSLRRVLDQVAAQGGEIVIERHHAQIARLVAGPGRQNALEAMADLYRTLPDDLAEMWESNAKAVRWKGEQSGGRLQQRAGAVEHVNRD